LVLPSSIRENPTQQMAGAGSEVMPGKPGNRQLVRCEQQTGYRHPERFPGIGVLHENDDIEENATQRILRRFYFNPMGWGWL
ncbi:hypothetical protein ACTZM0_27950, partial [Klebsiella pneumoniae]